MGHCGRRLGLIAAVVGGALAPAQAPAQLAPVGVPRGAIRVELDGSIDIWDTRYRDGIKEPLGAPLSSPALGSDLLPALGDADARIERITGIPDYSLNLGALTTDVQTSRGRGFAGLALGLTGGITIFGRIPYVETRTQSHSTLDPAAADAGVNPGSGSEAAFFGEFDAALAALSGRLAAGDYDGSPSLKAQAQATLDEGTALRADLFGLLSDPTTASPFVPIAGSTSGTAIAGRVTDLQSTLANDFGISGFSQNVVLPATSATADDVRAYISDPLGPVATIPSDFKFTFRGDAEAGVALTLIDHWDRGTHRGGFRTALQGLVRFPTGKVIRPERMFGVGTGDGQTDVETRLTLDMGAGAFGLRAEGDYNHQMAADYLARVAPPSNPLPGANLLTAVRRDPGDVLSLTARPFLRLARTFAIQGSATYWSRGADDVTYATPADSLPGVDPSVLAQGTKANATVLGIGVTYSNPGRLRAGGQGWPVDASWEYQRVVHSGEGIVPGLQTFTASFRLYFGLF